METDVLPPSPVADLASSSPPNLSEPVPEHFDQLFVARGMLSSSLK